MTDSTHPRSRTTMSTDDDPHDAHQALTLARYTDLTWHPLVQQTEVPVAALDAFTAAALHVAPHTIAAYRVAFAHTRRSALHQLLSDANLTELLIRLPAILGQRIVVIGDSISADALSWANLLRDLVTAVHPQMRLVNNSVAGRTTSEGIPALAAALAESPTHVFIMLGVNDIRRYGTPTATTMTSTAETGRNLAVMRRMAVESGAVATLITPPPTSPSVGQKLWKQTDLDELDTLIRDVDPAAITLRVARGIPRDYWLSDGVHPTPAGQNHILRSLLTALGDRLQNRERTTP